ncbi:putative membrane protein [Bacteroides fragilis str. 3986 N(B)19]|nr:putative membrane protein [Bacteroides fragilis str. 3986 N(B)19]
MDIFKMDAIMDFLYTIISGVILFWIKIIISWSFTYNLF